MPRLLACPTCKRADNLRSVETASLGYSVTVDEDGEIEYGEYAVYDEGTSFADAIECDNCRWAGGQSDLIPMKETTS